ncbi:SAF domain-containing protein [Streptomyces sp. NPDC003077]|uniref:SAF domain-containing protein n=1 Tax=Streptomyces sp. NPDC003077 TaxID=3154443 RepID=UPI0033AB7E63
MIASSVGFTALLAQAGRKVPVLVVTRSMPAGAVVSDRDVREVRLGVDDAAGHVVLAADRNAVVGRTTTVPLVEGALLAPQELGDQADYPPAGKAEVSFAVEPGGLPAGLAAGQRVAVLPGAASVAAAEPGDRMRGGAPAPLVGTVREVEAGESDSAASTVTALVETAAAGRAATIDKPRVVVLSPMTREVP